MINMTKDQLKEFYNAPKEEDYASYSEFMNAKRIWVEENPDEYNEILAAPSD